jgi:hydroxymethylpyrimidine/phosphomethylpyrimidine kinase
MPAIALTVAGSDPSGGAGIQADLKTFHQFGVYGEAVVSLLTVQNTLRVTRAEVVPAELVLEQLRAVTEDIAPAAAKTGAIGSVEIARALAEFEWKCPLVVDPVIVSKHGQLLFPEPGALKPLVARAALVTPNIPEAEALTETTDLRDAARKLCDLGAGAVLIKGGHGNGPATDILFDGKDFREFSAERRETRHTHGTGCTLSAAITACLAQGLSLYDAVARAKRFISRAISSAPGLGNGYGPVNHHAPIT